MAYLCSHDRLLLLQAEVLRMKRQRLTLAPLPLTAVALILPTPVADVLQGRVVTVRTELLPEQSADDDPDVHILWQVMEATVMDQGRDPRNGS